jgi:hypothetical protein
MSIEGRIAIDVGFTDSATSTGVQSVKRISLTSTDAYTSGKVVVVAGTCGTAAVSISVEPGYRDADGASVAINGVTRFAFASSGRARCSEEAGVGQTQGRAVAISGGNRVAISDIDGNPSNGFSVVAYSGTVSYTLVIYGTS